MKNGHAILLNEPELFNRNKFLQRVESIVSSGIWANNGPMVKAVENFHLFPKSIVVTNATVGLELSLRAVLGKRSGKVIVPAYTFVATASSVIRAGFEPLFVDVNEDYCLSPEHLEKVLKSEKNVVALIGVHLFGNVFSSKIPVICNDYEIPFIVDAAHCSGMNLPHQDERAIVRSYHPTKLGGGFELGVIETCDENLGNKLCKMRNFGLTPTAYDANTICEGTNAKANEISAAAVLTQLERKEEILKHYMDIYNCYLEYLPDNFDLVTPNHNNSNYSYVVVQTEEDTYDVIDYLSEYGIQSRKYFNPLPRHSFYSKFYSGGKLKADKLYKKSLCLPTGLRVNKNDVKYVCSKLNKY